MHTVPFYALHKRGAGADNTDDQTQGQLTINHQATPVNDNQIGIHYKRCVSHPVPL